ncbi:MAG: copper-binding protein [Novosphingobium sp.]
MKTITILATALALTACNKAADVPAKPVASTDMPSMDMSAAAVKTGHGSGKITALDKAGGKITITHGPIAGVGWPAMTMEFKANAKELEAITVGDQVDFDLTLKGSEATVTAIKKR